MNRRGIFITFMVFLLAASILALYEVSKKTDFGQERNHIDEAAFDKVNNAFNNLYEEVVSLNKEGRAREIQQRPMPFTYDFNMNSIILRQRVPARNALMEAYLDAVNIYSIFANAESTTDLTIATQTLQNWEWGSEIEHPDLNYAILPQCLLYDINACCFDGNYMVLKALNDGEYGCVGGFDYADLNVVDINITLYSNGCASGSIGGNLGGKTDPYDASSTKPYLKITVNEINQLCPGTGCVITGQDGIEVRSMHFDPETFDPATEIDSLLVGCGGQNWLRVKAGMESENDPFPVVIYNSLNNKPVNVDLNLTFDQKVELFYFTSFSISVEKKNFPVKRST